MAKYMLYIGGFCESPVHYLLGVVLPWLLGAVVNHLQIYSDLINLTALVTMMYVQFVCPMFMWAKACKEAQIYETNFRTSMQMMMMQESEEGKDNGESVNGNKRDDGVPSIDNS